VIADFYAQAEPANCLAMSEFSEGACRMLSATMAFRNMRRAYARVLVRENPVSTVNKNIITVEKAKTGDDPVKVI
jgi:hypothetical protein